MAEMGSIRGEEPAFVTGLHFPLQPNGAANILPQSTRVTPVANSVTRPVTVRSGTAWQRGASEESWRFVARAASSRNVFISSVPRRHWNVSCEAAKPAAPPAPVTEPSVNGKNGAGGLFPARTATVHRKTGETDVTVTINIDGTGRCSANTGIPFLDHMLHQIASHGLVDLEVHAEGDLHIDDHHTNEDVGITLGMALAKALGDRRGINRFGNFLAPLDEALVMVSMDFSGRPHLGYGLELPTQRVGTYDTQLVREFYVALVNHSAMTLHIRQLDGINSHHIIEASFKAFARAMRLAAEYDLRRIDTIPSSKGVL